MVFDIRAALRELISGVGAQPARGATTEAA
jgi:hypothetical protein